MVDFTKIVQKNVDEHSAAPVPDKIQEDSKNSPSQSSSLLENLFGPENKDKAIANRPEKYSGQLGELFGIEKEKWEDRDGL